MPPKTTALWMLVATRSRSAALSRVTCFQLRLNSIRSCSASGGERRRGAAAGPATAAASTLSSATWAATPAVGVGWSQGHGGRRGGLTGQR